MSHFYERLDVFLNVLAIFNESHSQNTVLTRFVLRSIKRNLEKTNRIRRDINRNMCDENTTIILIAIQFSIQKQKIKEPPDPIDLYQIPEIVIERFSSLEQ